MMQENRQPFKRPSKKHQPRGLVILHEDHDILVVNKAHTLLTISTEREKDKTAYSLLTNYVKKGNPKSKKRIFIVHRLDRDTSGVLVFAKSENAKRYLQEEWKGFNKTYFAVIHGNPEEKEGMLTSYLLENQAKRMYSVNGPSHGKGSQRSYKVLKESKKYSLLKINLFTGRKHQIRVQFSEEGYPLVGDKMYGRSDKGINRLALHAASLTISHPFSKEKMCFETEVPRYFNALMKS